MAASVATATNAVVLSNEPFFVTKSEVTVTIGDSGITDDFTVVHNGPDDVEPDFIMCMPTGGTGNATVAAVVGQEGINSTTTSQLNCYVTMDAIGTSGETLTYDLFLFWLPKSADVGQTAPVGYTAPANTNI